MSCLTETWISQNKDFEYRFFDEKQRRFFIEQNFGDDWLKIYLNCNSLVFRADIWKMLVAYEYGGIIADIDTICFQPIDNFIDREKDFVCESGFGKEYGWINNSIFGSSPKGFFISHWTKFAFEKLKKAYPNQPTIGEAGPLGLSTCMDHFIENNKEYNIQFCSFNFPSAKDNKDSVMQINASTLWNDANPGFDFSYLNDIYADLLFENSFQIKIIKHNGHGGYPLEIKHGF